MLTKFFAALMTVLAVLGAAVPATAPSVETTESMVVSKQPRTAEESVAHPQESTEAPRPAERIEASAAEAIALESLGISREDVRFDRTELDYERKAPVWEVEFRYGDTEYDFVIHAETGDILHVEQEIKRPKEPEISSPPEAKPEQEPVGTEITEAQAIELALAHAGLTVEQATRVKIEKDRDDGVWVYEIEFRHEKMEYDYEIRVSDGKILDWDKDWDD